MFAKEIYIRRRSALCGKMGSGLILIPGNMLTPNNYLNNAYYFRQDSSFLYYFGLNTPALVGLIDADSGEVALYGDDFTVEDIIWTGPQPSLCEPRGRSRRFEHLPAGRHENAPDQSHRPGTPHPLPAPLPRRNQAAARRPAGPQTRAHSTITSRSS